VEEILDRPPRSRVEQSSAYSHHGLRGDRVGESRRHLNS